MSQRHYEDRIKNWKSKAITRRKENEQLKRRQKELIASRDNWKNKYQTSKQAHQNSLLNTKKARGHHYPLLIVMLVAELYKYGGIGLRGCRHTLACMYICLNLKGRTPCHNSIRNWLCKLGYYRVQNVSTQKEEYVIYVDESISFGSEKILLFLGVKADSIPKGRSLRHDDMEVLGVNVSSEWKGEQVAEKLKETTANKIVKYAVSDEGNNLKKAYKALNFSHIEDCTHVLANHLKRLYNLDENFQQFSKLIGRLRQKWNLSKAHSQYTPPSMRGKMRFANIFPTVNWARKLLLDWENLPLEVREQAAFLKLEEAFIRGLVQVEKIFKMVCKDLKLGGFGELQKKKIADKLEAIRVQNWELWDGQRQGLEPQANTFIENVKSYLDNLENKNKALNEDFLLCSSDHTARQNKKREQKSLS